MAVNRKGAPPSRLRTPPGKEPVGNSGFREPRFEINRRVLLRGILVVILFAFFALIVRVASIGFGGNVRNIDRVDREMQSSKPPDPVR